VFGFEQSARTKLIAGSGSELPLSYERTHTAPSVTEEDRWFRAIQSVFTPITGLHCLNITFISNMPKITYPDWFNR